MSDNRIIRQCLAKLNNQPHLNFAECMSIALYGEDGYYQDASRLGADGDFVTAPLISPFFIHAVASWVKEQGCDRILEVGAGSGRLANGLIESCEMIQMYWAVDQHGGRCSEPSIGRIKPTWQAKMPDQWSGVVIANELIDALPVRRFCWDKEVGLQEFLVVPQGRSLKMILKPIEPLEEISKHVLVHLQNQPGPYVFEYCFELDRLFEQWSKYQGPILLIDYGHESGVYYHPDRTMGSLLCIQNHKVVPFQLSNLGQFDISAAVNWSQVERIANQYGFRVSQFGPQSDFLMAYGDFSKITKGIQSTISFEEMGQYMKVMALTKVDDF